MSNDPNEALRRVREVVDEYFGPPEAWCRPMDGRSMMKRIRDILDVRGF